MQHRLMILGSMDEFVELVKMAKSRGYFVISCDGYSDGRAKAIADKGYTIDVRDTDAIARVCLEEHVDGIITSFSDLMAECMVSIAEKAGLECYARSDRFNYLREKPLMKQMFDDLGIPTAKTVKVRKDSIGVDIAPIGFPCVVKPVNGYGSRGVYVLDNEAQIAERFDEIVSYSAFDYILAESYMGGYEFNMMNWLVDGKAYVIGLADREKSNEIAHAIPHVSRNAYPSRFIDEVCEPARLIAERIAAYVGIETGPVSLQFFWSPEQGIRVCEAAGRLLGYEHELVTIASGFSIEGLPLDYVYDREAMKESLESHDPHFQTCSAVLYFHGHERRIADLRPAELAVSRPGVVDTTVYYNVGETVRHGVGAMPYVLRSYLEAATRDDLDDLTRELFDSVKVLDDDGDNLLYANAMLDYAADIPGAPSFD